MKSSVARGDYQLVFFTPELIIDSSKWREVLKSSVYKSRMRALVIDEAHTVKKW